MTLNPGLGDYLSMDDGNDQDWFSFRLTELATFGHYAAITFDHVLGNLDLQLYNAAGTLLRSSAGVRDDETISFDGLLGGTYYLRVIGNRSANPAYALTITGPGGDWAESNNTLATALPLPAGPYRRDGLNVSLSDVDWFRITTPRTAVEGHFVRIDFTHAHGDLDLELYDAGGVLLRASQQVSNGEQVSLAGLAAGNYHVKVVGYSGARNPAYVLTVNPPVTPVADVFEPNNSLAQARDLGRVQGQTGWGGDTYYPLSIGGDGHYAAVAFDPGRGDLDLELVDGAGVVLARSATGKELERVSLAGRPAGTYYLRVFGFNRTTHGDYALLVDAPAAGAQPDWAEPNDARIVARNLRHVQGAHTYGQNSIHASGNDDWFQLETAAAAGPGHLVAITTEHARGDLDLQLYDGAGTLLASSTGASNVEQISLAGRPAGVYYVRVFGAGGATNPSYTLDIHAPQLAVADWTEPHETLAAAFDLREVQGLFSATGLSIHQGTDQDWFRMQTAARIVFDSMARIDFSHARGNLELRLYNAAGTELDASTTANDFEEVGLAGLAAGTYYLRVSGTGGAVNPDYTLRVTAPAAPRPDWLEGHDTLATAYDLRQVFQNSAGARAASNGALLANASFISNPDQFGFTNPDLFSALNPGAARGSILDWRQPLSARGHQDPQLFVGVTNPELLVGVSNPEEFPTILTGFDRQFRNGSLGGVPLSFALVTSASPLSNYALLSHNTAARSSPLRNPFNGYITDPCEFDPSTPSPAARRYASFNPTLTTRPQVAYSPYLLGGYIDPNEFGFLVDPEEFGVTNPDEFGFATDPEQFGVTNPDLRRGLATVIFGGPFEPFSSKSAGIQTRAVLPGLSIHAAGNEDWFRFDLAAEGAPGQAVRLAFNHALGDLDLDLFDNNGTGLDIAAGKGNSEEVNLNDLPPGTYYVRVRGAAGAASPHYTLSFTLASPLNPVPDALEPNPTRVTARDLRTVEGSRVLGELSLHAAGDRDWFAFTTTAAGTAADFVRAHFNHLQGDVDIALYNAAGTLLASSAGRENFEEISLAGRPAGLYYVEVFGYQNLFTSPQYTLVLHAPEAALTPDRLEPNSSSTQAVNLNAVNGLDRVHDLTLTPGDSDWFRFTIPATGTAKESIGIDSEHGAGSDLQLELYTLASPTAPIRSSRGTTGTEVISLGGLAAGTYLARVFGNSPTDKGTYLFHIDLDVLHALYQATDSWTIMVYVTASTLSSFARLDINEMEKAASLLPGTVKFAVLWDQSEDASEPQYPTGNGAQPAWGTTGRAIIEPDTKSSVATTFDLSIGEQNSGDPATLTSFINWAAGAAPAAHYALILWDHGGGVFGFNTDDRDPGASDKLTPPELRQAIQAAGRYFDVIAFDECLMAMAEVGYAIRPAFADVLVASEENVPGPGFDYDTAFAALQSGGVNGQGLASSMVQSYQQQYQNHPGYQDTLSAVDLAALADAPFGDLTIALASFTTAVDANATLDDWTRIRAARDAAVSFGTSFRDLGQFMAAIDADVAITASIRAAAANVAGQLAANVVAKTADQRNTTGLSIYLPKYGGTIASQYLSENAGFLAATGWDDFLDRFVNGFTLSSSFHDWVLDNLTLSEAFNLHRLTGPGNILTGLVVDPEERDWFRFTIDAQPAASLRIVLENPLPTTGRLRVSLYDANRVLRATSSTGTGQDVITFSLAGLPAGETPFFVQVESTGGAKSSYQLTLDAPGTSTGTRDWTRGNDTTAKARDLGVLSAETVLTGMTAETNVSDWFEFATPRQEYPTQGVVHVRIAGSLALTAQVLDLAGTVLRSATGTGELHLEYASGNGAAYRLRIFGAAGQAPTDYALRFEPPTGERSLPFRDDFNRANSPALGLGWTERLGDFTVGGNQAALAAGLVSLATLTGVSAADVRLQADVDVTAAAGTTAGLMARYAWPGDFYLAYLINNGGSYSVRIERSQAGTTTLQSSATATAGTGRLRFDVAGGVLSLLFNGVLLARAVDFRLAEGGAGLRGQGGRYDNFSATVIGPPVMVLGQDAGAGPRVVVLDGLTRQVKYDFLPFPSGFAGGVRVAAGDVTGDGIADIITATGPGTAARVRVFDGASPGLVPAQITGPLGDFLPYGTGYMGGALVTVGDFFTLDGWAEVIVTPHLGLNPSTGQAPPLVLYDGAIGTGLASVQILGPTHAGGVRTALADHNGDGKLDLLVAPGPGLPGFVLVFSGTDFSLLRFVVPYPGFTGGVFVTAADLQVLDGKAEIVVTPDAGLDPTTGQAPPLVFYEGATGAPLFSFQLLGPAFRGGVRAAAGDVSGDGRADLLLAPGPGFPAFVLPLSGVDLSVLAVELPFSGFAGGVFWGQRVAAAPRPRRRRHPGVPRRSGERGRPGVCAGS